MGEQPDGGKADDPLADAFMVLEPSTNPMFASLLYEHPRDQIQVYDTEEAACEAAMTRRAPGIDAHLDGRKA